MDLVFFKRDSGRPGTSEGVSVCKQLPYYLFHESSISIEKQNLRSWAAPARPHTRAAVGY